jgi:hypothetical protein
MNLAKASIITTTITAHVRPSCRRTQRVVRRCAMIPESTVILDAAATALETKTAMNGGRENSAHREPVTAPPRRRSMERFRSHLRHRALLE